MPKLKIKEVKVEVKEEVTPHSSHTKKKKTKVEVKEEVSFKKI